MNISDLAKDIKNSIVTIHLEPCTGKCPDCGLFHKDSHACDKLKEKNR